VTITGKFEGCNFFQLEFLIRSKPKIIPTPKISIKTGDGEIKLID
jgi:hypothetical protein